MGAVRAGVPWPTSAASPYPAVNRRHKGVNDDPGAAVNRRCLKVTSGPSAVNRRCLKVTSTASAVNRRGTKVTSDAPLVNCRCP
jgi:hypothetical protein